MIYQDILMLIAGILFVISLIPQIILNFKHRKVLISWGMLITTIVGLFLVIFSMLTLKLFFTFGIKLITVLLCLIILIQKMVYK